MQEEYTPYEQEQIKKAVLNFELNEKVKIKTSQTIYVIRGNRENNVYLHKVFVNKVFEKNVTRHLPLSIPVKMRSVGGEEWPNLKKDDKKESKENFLARMCRQARSFNLSVMQVRQVLLKYQVKHTFVEDRNGNIVDFNQEKCFTNKKQALKYYRKIKKIPNFFIYETHGKGNSLGGFFPESNIMRLEGEEPSDLGVLVNLKD